LSLVRDLISIDDWNKHRRRGRGETVEDVLAELSTG
jgi:hypothetical protein